MFGPKMLHGKDISKAAKNLLGCVLHTPNSSHPIKEGIITEVQWYDLEENDPATTEDKQGDALLVEPGHIFIFESMGHTILLVSALSKKTRACVRINAVRGLADRAGSVTRAIGITSFNREKYQLCNILDASSPIYITKPEIKVPEPELFIPRRSDRERGMRIKVD